MGLNDKGREMKKILVLKNDSGIRPAGKPDECFYCNQKVGTPHLDDCILLLRKARVKITVELDAFVVNHDKENIEYSLRYKPHTMAIVLEQVLEQMRESDLEPEVEVKKIYDEVKRKDY